MYGVRIDIEPSCMKSYLVVLLSVVALVTGGNDGFGDSPSSVTVLQGSRLTLDWRTQLDEAEIVFCDIRFFAVVEKLWERFVGYSPIQKKRTNLSPSKGPEWDFLSDNPCMSGFSVNNAASRHNGLYRLAITIQNGTEFMHGIAVDVLQKDSSSVFAVSVNGKNQTATVESSHLTSVNVNEARELDITVTCPWPCDLSAIIYESYCSANCSGNKCTASLDDPDERKFYLLIESTSDVQGAKPFRATQEITLYEFLAATSPDVTVHHDKQKAVANVFIVLFVMALLLLIVLCLMLHFGGGLVLLKRNWKNGANLDDNWPESTSPVSECIETFPQQKNQQTGADAEEVISFLGSSECKGVMKKKKESKDELIKSIAKLERERDSVQINLADEIGKNEKLAQEVQSLQKSENELKITHKAEVGRLSMIISEMETKYTKFESDVEEYKEKVEKKDREQYAHLEKEAKELIETKLSKYVSGYEKLLNEYCYDTLKADLQQLKKKINESNGIADNSLQDRLIKEVNEFCQDVEFHRNRGKQGELSYNLRRYREYKESLEKTMQDKQNKVIEVGDAVSALSKTLQNVKKEHHKGQILKKLEEHFNKDTFISGVIEPIRFQINRIESSLESAVQPYYTRTHRNTSAVQPYDTRTHRNTSAVQPYDTRTPRNTRPGYTSTNARHPYH